MPWGPLASPSSKKYADGSCFELEDLNPNSEFYGQVIGPADFLGEISIIFFGHEY